MTRRRRGAPENPQTPDIKIDGVPKPGSASVSISRDDGRDSAAGRLGHGNAPFHLARDRRKRYDAVPSHSHDVRVSRHVGGNALQVTAFPVTPNLFFGNVVSEVLVTF